MTSFKFDSIYCVQEINDFTLFMLSVTLFGSICCVQELNDLMTLVMFLNLSQFIIQEVNNLPLLVTLFI